MRIVFKKYANGGSSAVETSNDGGSFVEQLAGRREVGQRISAYLEVTCDDNKMGRDGLRGAIAWLNSELAKRESASADVAAKKRRRKPAITGPSSAS